MKKVSIKYNPYRLETEIKIDGKKPKDNSPLVERAADGTRLQEWIEELPQILKEEGNDTEFEVDFHGTLQDYEDIAYAFSLSNLNIKLKHIPAKETTDKEKLIDDVFKEIQEGPFDELKTDDVINAFRHAKSSDFEVCVIATMSAGKSTLINAMLGTKLMPSKQEACTAIITRIKDVKDESKWQAEVYDKNGDIIETHNELTYSTMERLNSDERVSEISVQGDIPFVSSDDISLVLIDTPGPNNSRDPNHKVVQSNFLQKSSKSLVLYIMEGTYGCDDDNALLRRVADSMKVGGKQSKDRFIFVVNKMDDRKQEDGDTEQTLNKIRAYLERHGILNPNLFPAAALPALSIRLINGNFEVDEDTQDETFVKVRKLNRNATLHFEKYAPLPSSIRNDIEKKLSAAKDEADTFNEALIHTGVPSVEAAIRQYVLKYAKTAKIKNIVDTFMHKLDEIDSFEKTKRELAINIENRERYKKAINAIKVNISDGKSAKNFKEAINKRVEKVKADASEKVEEIQARYQDIITKKLNCFRGEELSVDEAEYEVEQIRKFAENLDPLFHSELNELIDNNLIKICNSLLNEYKNKLSSLKDELGNSDFTIDPLKFMEGSINALNDADVIERHTKSKDVWIENKRKKWYKPWTWFQEKGHYETVEYVNASEIAQTYLAPIQEAVYTDGDNARKYANDQSDRIAKLFKEEFSQLDEILKKKMDELSSLMIDDEKAKKCIEESEFRLKWLENIKGKVESILEI